MNAEFTTKISRRMGKDGRLKFRALLTYRGILAVAKSELANSKTDAEIMAADMLRRPETFITQKAQAKIEEAQKIGEAQKIHDARKAMIENDPAGVDWKRKFINQAERYGAKVERTPEFYHAKNPRADFLVKADGIYEKKSGSRWERVADTLTMDEVAASCR